jgi:hypothetical protein
MNIFIATTINKPHIFLYAFTMATVAFALATLYFWLLDKFEDNSFLYWVILIVGLLIGLL